MEHKATMHDVARVAGVSLMTVSRVLNGTAKVNPETEQLVRRAVEKLHYKPNELARALRGMKSRTIGIIVPYLYDQFFATCAHAAGVVAREHGYSVILATSIEDVEIEYTEAQLMLQRHVEGMLLIPANNGRSKLTLPEFERTPIVLLDRPIRDPRFNSILVQNQSGARRAVQHLIEQHRHKRIAFIGMSRKLYTTHARFTGYRREMVEHGLTPEAFFDCATQEAASIEVKNAMQRSKPPTAFFTMNNLTTRYCLRALMEIGVRIPEDVALVGFDDFELAETLEPALTVIRQPAEQLGNVAANFLFNRIKSAEPHPEG
ncbi:MAG TPA: LacI family DNA-binding transcriptional regulator, partial [Acidobacteriaceae bacterium]|nr:LacI family DNA-binding transcriptional regulator [Acidobacteriaceae bacterium]